jgi:glycoside/pentoside/hexuronide:cation symporter, GPH family
MMAYRVVFMTLAGLNVAVLGPTLIEAFGKGRPGYLGMAVVQGGIVLLAMWACAWVVARAPVVSGAPASPASSRSQIRRVLRHRPFVVYLAVKFLQLTAVASTSASLLYLARYVLGRDESFLVRFGLLQTLGTLLSLPVWTWLGRRYGKRNAYIGAGYCYALIVLTWLGAAAGEPGWVTDARLLMIGVGSTGLLVLGFSLLPDIMAHHTRASGVALEGTMGALYSVVEKGTAAVGPLLGGLVLQASGFVSAAGRSLPPVQPESALLAIILLSAVVPALFNVAGSLALLRFRLDDPPLSRSPVSPRSTAAAPALDDHPG